MPNVRRTLAVVSIAAMGWLPATGSLAVPATLPDAAGGPRGEVIARDPVVGRGMYHGVSRPARTLPDAPVRVTEPPLPVRPFRDVADASGADAPGARERRGRGEVPRAPEPKAIATPIDSFDGIASADQSEGILPPDANADVGPSHIVQMVNVSFEVFDKTGTSLMGPSPISDLWGGPIPGLCDDEDQGDPIVVYDELADRWLLSQFSFARGGSNEPLAPFYQCMAVSTGSDPTGTYHLYSFNLSDDHGTDTLLHDYPKIGVWPDGYYVTANQFDMAQDGVYAGAAIFVFERDAMLSGAAAEVVYFDLGADLSLGGMLPVDIDGGIVPPEGSPNWVLQLDANEFFIVPDGIRVHGVVVDWASPDDSFVGLAGIVDLKSAGLNFDPVLCVDTEQLVLDAECIPQGSSSQKLDPISDRLMWRAAYRNFGTHESIVASHTVDVNDAPRAGLQWFELRDPANPVVHQGGVVGESGGGVTPGGLHRWMGSVAMDGDGGIAAGYSVSSGSIDPGVRVAGHSAAGPLGVMNEGEAVVVAGGGSQSTSARGHRWGDYSSMSVDPADDCTFWYTNQYYASTSVDGWKTTIASFEVPGCDGMEIGSLTGVVETGLGALVEGATVFAGTLAVRTDGTGTFDFDEVPAGTYDVTATAPGHAPVTVEDVVITDAVQTDLGTLSLGTLDHDYADFDGDGFSDVAFGAPRDVRNGKAGGVVNVLYGSANGLTAAGDQILHQDLAALGGESVEAGDRFGSALAAGDFDGDGVSDLAIGAYGEDLGGRKNTGIVHVFYGVQDDGLDTSFAHTFHQNKSGVKDVNERNDQFGRALAAGDFDGDGDDDLAIGIPGEDGGRGTVLVLEGKPGGLSKDDTLWSQDSPGVRDRAERGDRFGSALAAGNLGRGFRDDLAVGVPNEKVGGAARAGLVNVLYGAAGGLSASGDQRWTQDSAGVASFPAPNDRLGTALAVGDANGDGIGDLAMSAPTEDQGGKDAAGVVHVLRGSASGLTTAGARFFHRATSGVAGGLGDFDRFGDALAFADVNGDGADDLVVGAPRDRYLGVNWAGTFNVIMGRVGASPIADDGRLWNQQMVGGSFAESDRFAEALTGADTNGDGLDDLIVGVPREDAGFDDFGIAHELRGSPSGITSLNGAFWHQGIAGVASNPRDREWFAGALVG